MIARGKRFHGRISWYSLKVSLGESLRKSSKILDIFQKKSTEEILTGILERVFWENVRMIPEGMNCRKITDGIPMRNYVIMNCGTCAELLVRNYTEKIGKPSNPQRISMNIPWRICWDNLKIKSTTKETTWTNLSIDR